MIICTYHTENSGHELHVIKDKETGISITFKNHKVGRTEGTEGLSDDVVQSSVLKICANFVTNHLNLVDKYWERETKTMVEFRRIGHRNYSYNS